MARPGCSKVAVGPSQGQAALGGYVLPVVSEKRYQVQTEFAPQRSLSLAWPHSHLAAPWDGSPATWTGLYAFRVKGVD